MRDRPLQEYELKTPLLEDHSEQAEEMVLRLLGGLRE